jgi:hypothetical protein
LLRILFGLAAIGWLIYCFYLGFLVNFGVATIVVYTVIFAAIVSFAELIRECLRPR